MKNIFTRFISVLFVLSICLSPAFAVPAFRGWQERTLADGTTVTVRLMGDEFYHFWETKDGKIAIQQEDGTFVISEEEAPSPKKVIQNRQTAAKRAGAVIHRNYGDLQINRVLVILVNFKDKSMQDKHNSTHFNTILNGAFPSVKDYFNTCSNGNYNPQFDIFGPYTLPQNMAYYGANKNDVRGEDTYPGQMVLDACALASQDGCNFSNYDVNNDGYVDNVYIVYAGYGEAAGAAANTIWPHSWVVQTGNYVSGTKTYNGKTIYHYACSAELSGTSGTNSDGVGTFAHEFSHVIGLPDYYDADYNTNGSNDGKTPGKWTLMDQGSYNGDGQYPPLYSIYDKFFMGWTTPSLLAKNAKKNVTLTTTWNDGYQITGGATSLACTNTNKIYYIENRQQSGYDQYLPGHGMIMWEVTYDADHWNDNDLNNYSGTLRYTIKSAKSNSTDLSAATTPFPGTQETTSVTPFTGCALTNIAESAGNVSFKYNGGVTTPRTVTWSVNGSTSSTVFNDGDALVLPSDPDDCSGTGGKKFVGWTANSSVSGSVPADLFTTAGSKTVTADITYYAVYATASGSGSVSKSYTFNITSSDFNTTSYAANNNEKTSTATASDESTVDVKWTSYQVMKNSSNMQFKKSEGYIYNSTDLGTITAVTITSSAGTFTTYYGDSEQPSSSTTVGGGFFKIVVGSTTGTVSNIVVTFEKSAGAGVTYSDYSLTCGTPCSNTPSMSFNTATVNKTTADASYTQAVTISNKGSGQTVAYSSSDETVGTVNASGVVTLKGKVGSTTITASVETNGTYCAASASYTINVSAAPINVTLYYNNTSATLNNQTNPYTLPTGSPYNTAMCDGAWTFDGWYGSSYTKSETKPTYITELTATGSAYAVYKTTETTSGAPVRKATMGTTEVASVTFKTVSTDGTNDKSGSISTDLVDSDSGISSYSGSKLFPGTAGVKLGGSSAIGYITLTLSATASVKTVNINASKYGSDTGKLKVTIGTTVIDSKDPASNLSFTATNAISTNTIKVETTSKRAYIASITVIAETSGGTTSTTYYATTPDCATPPPATDYTVTWKACGETFDSKGYASGAALTMPASTPSDNAGKVFVGWTATQHYTGATAPADLFTSAGSKTVTADVTYYAVFQ